MAADLSCSPGGTAILYRFQQWPLVTKVVLSHGPHIRRRPLLLILSIECRQFRCPARLSCFGRAEFQFRLAEPALDRRVCSVAGAGGRVWFRALAIAPERDKRSEERRVGEKV